MSDHSLPTEEQRVQLNRMIATAFVEIRLLGWAGRAKQAADLADTFHNLPNEMYGYGKWDPGFIRKMLQFYQDDYHHEDYHGRTNYVGIFNAIFPRDGE